MPPGGQEASSPRVSAPHSPGSRSGPVRRMASDGNTRSSPMVGPEPETATTRAAAIQPASPIGVSSQASARMTSTRSIFPGSMGSQSASGTFAARASARGTATGVHRKLAATGRGIPRYYQQIPTESIAIGLRDDVHISGLVIDALVMDTGL
jgi:hypothetical protein